MSEPNRNTQLANLWDDAVASGMSESEKLRYRSNLLGADLRITNFGGGNTSAKTVETDPLTGGEVEVMWVKGSGGDLGSIDLEGFATLYMDKLLGLRKIYRGPDHEDEMVGYLPHCTFALNPRAASIDTPLHAYVPRRHVDHMHPDAIIAIAASKDSKELTERIFGDEIGWLPWRRPGFELGLWLQRFCEENPGAKGVVLESHGLFTWDEDAKGCYELTLSIIQKAIDWLEGQGGEAPAFGGEACGSLPAEERRAAAARMLPAIRGMISSGQHKVGHFDDQDAVLEFVNSRDLGELAPLGTSCPDHFLRTKIRPLVVGFDPSAGDVDGALAGLEGQIALYREDYEAYYKRCSRGDSPPLRDPNPVIYLIPGVGMLSFAKDKATARIAGEFYVNAINVMRGASSVSEYRGLPEQEAFDIEYWQLEEAKLRRMPKPRSLAGRIALVTGAAGGIGSAIADRFLAEGACMMLADIDEQGLKETEQRFAEGYGADAVRSVRMDVTCEKAVAEAYSRTVTEFGGVDFLVANAGIASASPIEDTTLELWNRNQEILGTGYFLSAREIFRILLKQGIGGSIVFIASKNGLAASAQASAYCTAKASEIHLARCLALEGAEHGIRVNVVNPDAVLRGSKIWEGEWLEARLSSHGSSGKEELEERYRERSLLKRSVYPEDVAEAAYFLVSDRAAKSTGNIINVDAGNAISFTR